MIYSKKQGRTKVLNLDTGINQVFGVFKSAKALVGSDINILYKFSFVFIKK